MKRILLFIVIGLFLSLLGPHDRMAGHEVMIGAEMVDCTDCADHTKNADHPSVCLDGLSCLSLARVDVFEIAAPMPLPLSLLGDIPVSHRFGFNPGLDSPPPKA